MITLQSVTPAKCKDAFSVSFAWFSSLISVEFDVESLHFSKRSEMLKYYRTVIGIHADLVCYFVVEIIKWEVENESHSYLEKVRALFFSLLYYAWILCIMSIRLAVDRTGIELHDMKLINPLIAIFAENINLQTKK